MAVVQVGITTGGNKKEFQGLSTDTKPTGNDIGNGSTFYEINTGKGFIYDTKNVNPATGNGWWGV